MQDRAAATCEQVRASVAEPSDLVGDEQTPSETAVALDGVNIVIAAGAARHRVVVGRDSPRLLFVASCRRPERGSAAGIGGVGVTDKAVDHAGVICYGAIGVGGTKMKIHKAAIKSSSRQTTWFSMRKRSTRSDASWNPARSRAVQYLVYGSHGDWNADGRRGFADLAVQHGHLVSRSRPGSRPGRSYNKPTRSYS